MKKAWTLLVIVSVFTWLMGCASSRSLDGFGKGGSGGGSNFEAGNWAFTTNGGINGPIYLGGNLSSSGTTVSGNLFVVGDQGSGFLISTSSIPMPVTGTLNNGTLTLTGAVSSSSFSMTFTGVSTSGTISSLPSGNYTVTGGTDNGDSGLISGVIASSYTGTWQGTDATTAGTVTVAMTEASTSGSPSPIGSYSLSPTSGSGVTFVGAAGCTVTGTLQSATSFAAGGFVLLDITTMDNGIAGELQFFGFANDPTAPTSLANSGYLYTGGTGCMLQNNTTNPVSFTLTKQ